MIFHLSASGTPVSWSIVALYKSSYGVAVNSARIWYDDSINERGDSPQCIIELDGDDEKGWSIKRSELWMGPHHFRRQTPDDSGHLVQRHSAPFALSDALGEAIIEALRVNLVEIGYLIPRPEWERRYPSQALISRRFAEFNAAHDAWREANPGMEDRMPFEARWTSFMATPKGHELQYGRGEDHVCERRPNRKWSRIDPPELTEIEDLDTVVRLLNSGWTPAEIKVLMAEEPVG